MAGVVFITGGATGIGAASARQAARAGFAIGINYRTHAARAARLVGELRAAGARAIAVAADVTDPEQVTRSFDVVERELGPVTALVNSAAAFLPATSVADADPVALAALLHTNVFGSMLCCREGARRLSTARGGPGDERGRARRQLSIAPRARTTPFARLRRTPLGQSRLRATVR